MTAVRRRIALVAPAAEPRTMLAAYLRDAGFDVHECSELDLPGAFTALVVLSAYDDASAHPVPELRAWLRAVKSQRIVVVTARPSALRDLVASHGERLRVLPAPAFGWDVVDALRAAEPKGPRGA